MQQVWQDAGEKCGLARVGGAQPLSQRPAEASMRWLRSFRPTGGTPSRHSASPRRFARSWLPDGGIASAHSHGLLGSKQRVHRDGEICRIDRSIPIHIRTACPAARLPGRADQRREVSSGHGSVAVRIAIPPQHRYGGSGRVSRGDGAIHPSRDGQQHAARVAVIADLFCVNADRAAERQCRRVVDRDLYAVGGQGFGQCRQWSCRGQNRQTSAFEARERAKLVGPGAGPTTASAKAAMPGCAIGRRRASVAVLDQSGCRASFEVR